MTDAQVSQVPVEVLRTNLAATADVSQLAVEILRPNAARLFSAATGTFTFTGRSASGLRNYRLASAAGAYTLSGEDAGSLQNYVFVTATGTFAFTGIAAEFRRPGSLPASKGAYVLSGNAATLKSARKLTASAASFSLTGFTSTYLVVKTLVAARGVYQYLGTPIVPGVAGDPGAFVITGQTARLGLVPTITLTEGVQFSESTSISWDASTTTTDSFFASDALKVALGVILADAVTTTDDLITAMYPTALITDAIITNETCIPAYFYNQTIIDSTIIADALLAAWPVDLADTIDTADVADGVVALLILDALTVGELVSGDATYAMALIDAIYAVDSLARFLDGTINDAWSVSETITPSWTLPKILTDALNLADVAEGKLFIRVTAADETVFADATPASWIFAPTITDNVEISIGYVSPNGNFTAWAVNTRTGAVSEYSNYEFNSFCQSGHKYLGSSSGGLYELNGTDDDGTDVIAHIKSGYAQFGGSKYSSFKAAYLGMRGDGDIILKLDTGDGKTYTYQTVIQDMQSTKVRLGKGLRARYFSFELISTGPDFDLDTIEFIPLVAQRRV